MLLWDTVRDFYVERGGEFSGEQNQDVPQHSLLDMHDGQPLVPHSAHSRVQLSQI